MATRKRLTDAGIARLRAGAREYTLWDTGVAGLGVRVRPSGSRTFVYHRKAVDGLRKMSFGPTALRRVEDVRRDCLAAASGAVAEVETGERRSPPAGADTQSCLRLRPYRGQSDQGRGAQPCHNAHPVPRRTGYSYSAESQYKGR